MAIGFIPIARAKHSSALVRGELMRYLAELAWAADAILHNSELRWRKDGPDTLSVSAGSGETASEVVLSLDSEGRIGGWILAGSASFGDAAICAHTMARSILRLPPARGQVASLCSRGRLGNRREGVRLLAGSHRPLGNGRTTAPCPQVTTHVRFASIATGTSKLPVRPLPLCPEGDDRSSNGARRYGPATSADQFVGGRD
jgi:hypothetical protein